MPKIDDNSLMSFGQYKGQKMANVPASYLLWLDDQPWLKPDLKAYIKENKDVLAKEAPHEKKTN